MKDIQDIGIAYLKGIPMHEAGMTPEQAFNDIVKSRTGGKEADETYINTLKACIAEVLKQIGDTSLINPAYVNVFESSPDLKTAIENAKIMKGHNAKPASQGQATTETTNALSGAQSTTTQ